MCVPLKCQFLKLRLHSSHRTTVYRVTRFFGQTKKSLPYRALGFHWTVPTADWRTLSLLLKSQQCRKQAAAQGRGKPEMSRERSPQALCEAPSQLSHTSTGGHYTLSTACPEFSTCSEDFLFCFSVKVKTTIYGSLLAPFPDRFVRMPSAHWILKVTLLLQPERYFWTIVKYQHDPLGLPWHHFYHFFLYLWEI